MSALSIDRALEWVDGLYDKRWATSRGVAGEALKEVRDRLQFMMNVGLHYLSLERPRPRCRAARGSASASASQLSCGLMGVLYVLDEPSIGLHARDQHALLDTLAQLRDLGNTVLVVEHDMQTARGRLDRGPGTGRGGCSAAK